MQRSVTMTKTRSDVLLWLRARHIVQAILGELSKTPHINADVSISFLKKMDTFKLMPMMSLLFTLEYTYTLWWDIGQQESHSALGMGTEVSNMMTTGCLAGGGDPAVTAAGDKGGSAGCGWQESSWRSTWRLACEGKVGLQWGPGEKRSILGIGHGACMSGGTKGYTCSWLGTSMGACKRRWYPGSGVSIWACWLGLASGIKFISD